MRKAKNVFAIATARAKDQGFSDFTEGSAGDNKRDEIAESIKTQDKALLKSLSKLVEDLH
jgi:hypothetical protein